MNTYPGDFLKKLHAAVNDEAAGSLSAMRDFFCGLTADNGSEFSPFVHLCSAFGCDENEQKMLALLVYFETGANSDALFEKLGGANYPTIPALCAFCKRDFSDMIKYFSRDSAIGGAFARCDGLKERIIPDRRIMDFILSDKIDAEYYSPLARAVFPESSADYIPCDATRRLSSFLKNKTADEKNLFILSGETGCGRKAAILEALAETRDPALIINGKALFRSADFYSAANRICREARIFGAFPIIADADDFTRDYSGKEKLRYLAGNLLRFFSEVFVTVADPFNPEINGAVPVQIHFEPPALDESLLLWSKMSAGMPLDDDVSFSELAGEFRMTPEKIAEALRSAQSIAALESKSTVSSADIKKGCYASIGASMGTKALRVNPRFKWDDLILPQQQKAKLRTACEQVRHKFEVYKSWGFDAKVTYGRGVSMIFSGPPGTGKTMAAQVVAADLGLELYRIELATVVSKYIGETEKNLSEIFLNAEKSQVVLFFDEADVLFSKRTEIKDSNDKYSNMEAAFLLQKTEAYEGITILATNYIQNFDEAFKRRVKFLIDFPFPSAQERRQIWQHVFPAEAPLGELDFDYLTEQFELSGSNIKNIALHAAFLSSAEGCGIIEMKHMLKAVKNEYEKSGKMFTKADAGQYFMLL